MSALETGSAPEPTVTATPAVLPAPARAAEHGLRLSSALSWRLSCLALDATMLAAAVVAARVGSYASGASALSPGWAAGFGVLVLAGFGVRGLYAPRIRLDLVEHARGMVVALTVAGMALLSAEALFAPGSISASNVVRLWAFAAVYTVAGRAALYWSQDAARRSGVAQRPTLVVGAGRVGQLVAQRLESHPEFGLRPVGFLDKEPLGGDRRTDLPVLGASWDLERVVAEHGVEQVIVAFSTAPHEVLVSFVDRCSTLGLDVAIVPRLFERANGRLEVEHVGGLPLLTARAPDPAGWRFATKYALDRIVAAALLLLTLPVAGAAALVILATMGRPVVFRQRRVGRDGSEFDIFKFRTMRPSSEGVADVSQLVPAGLGPGGVEGSDRRTRLGTFLRRTSIDELPQLLNVLRGDMSIVGPRPERPEFANRFARTVYRYDDRHRVKSGITGWAQVHGLRGKTPIADRAEWDNWYIENWTPWLDLKILLLTAVSVVRGLRSVE